MTSKLPPDLLRLFTPRPALEHVKQLDCAPEDKPKPRTTGIAQHVAELLSCPKSEPVETVQQRKDRLKKERAIQARDNIIRGVTTWDP
ncbi:hypothetical protein GGF37_007094, partial [Kickxella alabastrina]